MCITWLYMQYRPFGREDSDSEVMVVKQVYQVRSLYSHRPCVCMCNEHIFAFPMIVTELGAPYGSLCDSASQSWRVSDSACANVHRFDQGLQIKCVQAWPDGNKTRVLGTRVLFQYPGNVVHKLS